MIVKILPVGPVQTNCYIVGDADTGAGVVIDPGGDAAVILQAVEELDLEIDYVLNTHGHFDHTMANAEVVKATGAELAIHPGDAAMLAHGGQAALFGLHAAPSTPTHLLQDGEVLLIGNLELEVMATPGHTPGGCSFLSRADDAVFCGDCLFQMGIGRTDLPGGDYEELDRTLRERLLSLPDRTVVYPGHGPRTTIGEERRANPFLQ